MPSATVHTARRSRECGSYPCQRSVEPGQRYRRHVAFPGDEGHEEGTRPWVIIECRACAESRGYPITEEVPDDPS